MYKYIGIIMMSFLTIQIGWAQDYVLVENVQEIQDKIIATNDANETMTADFTQEKHMDILDEPLVSTGQFYFAKPENVRWEYVSPYTYLVILKNNRVQIKDGEDLTNYDLSNNQIFKEINKVMSGIMNGKMIGDKNFDATVYENSSSYKVNLIPNIKSMSSFIQEIELIFDKESLLVQQVTMYEEGEDKTILNFSNIKVNETIDDTIFEQK